MTNQTAINGEQSYPASSELLPAPRDSGAGLMLKATMLVKQLSWLIPIRSLHSKTSGRFGRNIESELHTLEQHSQALMLTLRQRKAAVVIPLEHYEALVKMKELCEGLLKQQTHNAVNQAAVDFDALYQRFTGPQHRKAGDALFSASPQALASTYKPGKTEKQ